MKIDRERLLSLERPKALCAECGEPINVLDRHPTSLRLSGEDQKRQDFCPECWEFAKNDVYDSYWITKRVKKAKNAPKLTRREKAVAVRALFESLWEERDREDVDVDLYFLSHLLLRWGGLKFRASEQDDEGREIIVFENPTTGDPIEIRSVTANDDALIRIKERIDKFLAEYAPDDDSELR